MAGTPVAGDPPPLLRNGGFYRLLSVRLVGSFSDGLLQAGLATFILFSPERQPTPLAIAVAFAILLLPYSLISPFAGVFLDRWRRRQVLLYANWARALVVLGVAGLVFAERDGIDLGITVLVALGIGRFVLAGLSASLPHLVPPEQLVPANSISPTAGSIIFGVGAVAGIGLRGAFGGGDSGAALLLCLAAAVYVAAGTLALTLRAGQLGPDGDRPADTVAGAKPLPAGEMPATYINTGLVPTMGAHWIDVTAPELNGQPFTETFIFGSFDGKMTFYEPMITKAFIEEKHNH